MIERMLKLLIKLIPKKAIVFEERAWLYYRKALGQSVLDYSKEGWN